MQVILQADQRQQNHNNEILPAHSQELYLLVRELGLMLNQENIRSPIFQCRRKPTSRQWWSDWILENKRWSSEPFFAFSTLVWWRVEEQHGRRRRKQEKISVSELFKVIQDVVLLTHYHMTRSLFWTTVFFKCIYQVGCAINLQSNINSGLIVPGGQISATDRQYSFCLWIPMDEEHKDPDTIDLEAPRLAQYMHAPSMEQTSKYGVLGRHQPCS